jgi:hypothetical protein
MAEEMGIYRGEVLTIMVALADIRVDLGRIRDLLEDENGGGRGRRRRSLSARGVVPRTFRSSGSFAGAQR